MIEHLLWDARLAVRALTRSPGFSAVTVVLMALGIATTTTLFSLTYGVLLKPLPWSEPDRVVRLQEMRGGRSGRVPWTITNTTYHAWREQPTTVEAIGGWTRTRGAIVTVGGGAPERVRVASVTPSLFRTVGVPPVAGRVFSDEDVNSRLGVIVLGFNCGSGGSEDVRMSSDRHCAWMAISSRSSASCPPSSRFPTVKPKRGCHYAFPVSIRAPNRSRL